MKQLAARCPHPLVEVLVEHVRRYDKGVEDITPGLAELAAHARQLEANKLEAEAASVTSRMAGPMLLGMVAFFIVMIAPLIAQIFNAEAML